MRKLPTRQTIIALCSVCLFFVVASDWISARPPKKPSYEQFYWKRRVLETMTDPPLDFIVSMAKDAKKNGWTYEAEELALNVLLRDEKNTEALQLLDLKYNESNAQYWPSNASDLMSNHKLGAGGVEPAEDNEIGDAEDGDGQTLFDESREVIDELKGYFTRKAKQQYKVFPVIPNERYWKVYLEQRMALKILADEAFKIIFDKTIYPDENHGIVGQPSVDVKVNAARQQRAVYFKLLKISYPMKDVPTNRSMSLEQFLLNKCHLYQLCKASDSEEEFSKLWADIHGFELELLMRYQGGDFRFVVAEGTKYILNHSEFTPHRELVYRLLYEGVARHNETMQTCRSSDATAFIKQVNDYRSMYDILPLPNNERMNVASLLHCKDMEERGYFAHESDKPGYETPSKRLAKEGYMWGGAENISGSAGGAFDGFYNSSGHHRNLLNPNHRSIGAGAKSNLTNTFGQVFEYEKVYSQFGLNEWCDVESSR